MSKLSIFFFFFFAHLIKKQTDKQKDRENVTIKSFKNDTFFLTKEKEEKEGKKMTRYFLQCKAAAGRI